MLGLSFFSLASVTMVSAVTIPCDTSTPTPTPTGTPTPTPTPCDTPTPTPTPTAVIKVLKQAVGGNGTFDFALDETGDGLYSDRFSVTTLAEANNSALGTFNNVPIFDAISGTNYRVTENNIPNTWSPTSTNCVYSNGTDATLNYNVDTGIFTVYPGDEVTCTFTNTFIGAHVTVIKKTIGGDGTFHFTGLEDNDGFDLATSVENDHQAQRSFDVTADVEMGTDYTITEDTQDGWGLTNSICEYDGVSFGRPASNSEVITVHQGDDVACTFTNTSTTPTPTPEPSRGGGGGGGTPGQLITTPTPSFSPTPTPSTGGNAPEVLGTSTEVGDPANLTKYGLKEGDLIRAVAAGDPDVFILNSAGYKRLFLNPTILLLYPKLGGWSRVKPVTAAVRDSFPTSGLFRSCGTGDSKVYGAEITGEDTGFLHWINTSGPQAVSDDQHFFKKVFCINEDEVNWFPKK